MTRPDRYDEAVIARAAALLFDRLPTDCDGRADGDEDLRDALVDHEDGYAIARALETRGWVVDAEMVAALDGGCLADALDELTEQWVKTSGIRPRLALGAAATVKLTGRLNGVFEGTIGRIHERDGTYTVRIPALGHVPAGQLGTQGLVLPWENVDGEPEEKP